MHRTLLLLICCLFFLNGCLHGGSFLTEQYGDYEITFDTSGNCLVYINGQDRIKSKLSTNFEPYSDSKSHQKQAKQNSSDFGKGRVRCTKKLLHSNYGIQAGVVELSFDPSKIKDGVGVYGKQDTTVDKSDEQEAVKPADRLIDSRLDITIGSELRSGVSVPGGVCSSVNLRSSVFSIERIRLDNGHEEYTVTGRGRYWCQGAL